MREAHKNFASEIEEEIVVIVGSSKKKPKATAQMQDEDDVKPNVTTLTSSRTTNIIHV